MSGTGEERGIYSPFDICDNYACKATGHSRKGKAKTFSRELTRINANLAGKRKSYERGSPT